ncbi:MetQ/NlpA family ABC transporter substrate-binding protein [Tepidibacillus infernus]|uniref:Lipoprotein n=1 Tax=Tepidibacillus decaturensis TaxID=1413211 RepID=A0A135L5J2_9BACI|nr:MULTISPECIES: MetQ/NlpA family ABC transporter substrate-binding protein [Tepidibacillus]KXG44246.1 methionine ABC transporter substrate-binding protein [Tepidibacillus decaturensis]GBF10220.1 D-methionine-binding lipoprotein MetQ precursor [Tepidibacillus sp. HK-1]
MKKFLALFLIAVLSLTLAACGSGSTNEQQGASENGGQQQEVTLKVGATAVPHAEILEVVKPLLEKQGIKLDIVEYQDYVLPNTDLAEKQIDANYFQHVPYLESFSKDRGLDLTYIAKVHIEPMGIYSKKVDDLSKLEDKATVSIPNDPTNGGRALALLEKAGLIKLKEGVGINGTVQDVVENPKNLEIKELEAPMLPRSLDDVTISVINTNYALEAQLNPTKDALFIEDADSPYANVLAVRTEDKDNENLKKLAEALTSPEVKKFIEEKYNGAVVPAF